MKDKIGLMLLTAVIVSGTILFVQILIGQGPELPDRLWKKSE